jgi:hypothetical protein
MLPHATVSPLINIKMQFRLELSTISVTHSQLAAHYSVYLRVTRELLGSRRLFAC